MATVANQVVDADEASKNDSTNYGPLILASCCTVTFIALISVVARIYVLLNAQRVYGQDDLGIFVALAISLAALGLIIAAVANGTGVNQTTISPELIPLTLRLGFIQQLVCMWGVAVVKISVAFFLLRFAPNKFYRHFLVCCIGSLVLVTTVCFLCFIQQCNPMAAIWDPSRQGNCFSQEALAALWYINNGISIVTDILFSILPLPMLWNVQIPQRVKIVLVAIMSLGLLAATAAVIKCRYLWDWCGARGSLADRTFVMIWSVVEINLGILAATMPCLKPLFKRILEKSLASASGRPSSGRSDQHGDESLDPKASRVRRHGNASPKRLLFEASVQTTNISNDSLRLERSLARAAQGMELDDIRLMYAEANRTLGAAGRPILSKTHTEAL